MSRRIAAVLALALAACGGSRIAYSPPQPTTAAPAETTATIAAGFDEAWSGVVQTLFDKNIPVDTVEKESGLVKTGEITGEVGKDCDCGSYLGLPVGGYGTYGGDAHYSYQFLVQRAGDRQTKVTVRSRCHARVESLEGELECRLQPAREAELRQAIAQKASASGG